MKRKVKPARRALKPKTKHVRILMPCYERPELATMLAVVAETHDLTANGIEWSIDTKHGIYPTALACNHGAFHTLANTPSVICSPNAGKTAITHLLMWGADNYPIDRGAVRALLDADRPIVGSTIRCKNENGTLGFQPFEADITPEGIKLQRVGDCVKVRRCGSGFMLVTRAALAKIATNEKIGTFISHFPGDEKRELKEIFRDETHPTTREWTPEDYYFCDRASEVGFEIWMNVSVRHGHIGKKDYRTSG